MTNAGIHLLTMPKWGLAMTQAKLVGWLVEEGAEVKPGAALVDIETEKVLSSVEAATSGVLRRKIAREGEVVRVGGLLAVIADPTASDLEIDQLIGDFQARDIPESVEEEAADPVPETIDVGGHRICYLRRGEGPESAILIHGFGGNLHTWLLNHESLASRHSVYALDLPGHGGSSKQIRDGTLSGFSELLEGFMDAMSVSKAHLVAHSMGGAVAILFALKNPERCLSLVLIGSAGLGPEIDTGYIQGFIAATRRNDLRSQLEKLFTDSRLITRQLVDDTLKYKRLDGVEAALRTIASQFCSNDSQSVILRDQLPVLRMPILALWGLGDRIVPVSHAINLEKHVQTEILTGYGHMVHMEAASKVNLAILSFWESLAR